MSGKCSQISTPGTLVWVGRNGPRTSAGASGLGSQVSSWLGPPTKNRRMQFTSFGPSAACRSPSDRPTAPAPRAPTRRKSRRVRPSQNRTPLLPSKVSMVEAPWFPAAREAAVSHIVTGAGRDATEKRGERSLKRRAGGVSPPIPPPGGDRRLDQGADAPRSPSFR